MSLSSLRTDRHWLLFYLFVIVSWFLVAFMSKAPEFDGQLYSLYGKDFLLQLCRPPNGLEDFNSLLLMWVIMAGAMMTPTLVPTLVVYQDLIIGGSGNKSGFFLIVFGFLLIWLTYSFLVSVLQIIFLEVELIDSTGAFLNPLFTSFLLLLTGLYQFSPFKEACLAKCRAPLTFFMQFWREGYFAAVKMGLRLGLSCLGCCWALMLLAFVGGTMSLGYMGLATFIMVVEKLPKYGEYITKPLGYLLLILASINGLIAL